MSSKNNLIEKSHMLDNSKCNYWDHLFNLLTSYDGEGAANSRWSEYRFRPVTKNGPLQRTISKLFGSYSLSTYEQLPQLAFTPSKLTMETPGQCSKSVKT